MGKGSGTKVQLKWCRGTKLTKQRDIEGIARGEAISWSHTKHWLGTARQMNHPAQETKGEWLKKPTNEGMMSCRCARCSVLQEIAPPLGAHSV